MAEHSPRRPAPGVVPLQDIPTSAPGLRFAVRFPAAPEDERPAAGRPEAEQWHSLAGTGGGMRPEVAHDAEESHPLAGTGKLFLAVAVARLAALEPGVLAESLTIRGEHRAAARSGTIRRMTGELGLTVDDAMALIVGTGDGACTVALLEFLADRGVEVLAEARRLAADLGLRATAFTALEKSTGVEGSGGAGESWGEGLVGTTTAADLCTLLVQLIGAPTVQAVPSSGLSNRPVDRWRDTGEGRERPSGSVLHAAVADRVIGWMGKTFEPAGLASALPGFGPRTIPHRTVSGLELLTPPGAPGCASVLILPAGVGTGAPTACVSAYQPPTRADGSAVSSREVTAVLGSLGLAVSAARR
jgi:hypothetical protein